MKKYLLLATLSVLTMALSACSHIDVKPAPVSDEVVDAGMRSDGHVKVSGALDAGTYRENEDYADVSAHGGKSALNKTVEECAKQNTFDFEKCQADKAKK